MKVPDVQKQLDKTTKDAQKMVDKATKDVQKQVDETVKKNPLDGLLK